jgi:hypothetical protein
VEKEENWFVFGFLLTMNQRNGRSVISDPWYYTK